MCVTACLESCLDFQETVGDFVFSCVSDEVVWMVMIVSRYERIMDEILNGCYVAVMACNGYGV